MGAGLVIGVIFGALGLTVVGTAIASSGSSKPRTLTGGGGGGGTDHIDDPGLLWMTCEQAVTALPDDLPMHDAKSFRVYVAAVLKSSSDAAGMDALATELEKNAGAGAHSDTERAACLRVAQCLRDRASLVRLIASGSIGLSPGLLNPGGWATEKIAPETTAMSEGPIAKDKVATPATPARGPKIAPRRTRTAGATQATGIGGA